mgnify:CR=1 FL=1
MEQTAILKFFYEILNILLFPVPILLMVYLLKRILR